MEYVYRIVSDFFGSFGIWIIFGIAFCISFFVVSRRVARASEGKNKDELPESVRNPYKGTRRLIASTMNHYGTAAGGAEELYRAIEKGEKGETFPDADKSPLPEKEVGADTENPDANSNDKEPEEKSDDESIK